MTNVAGMNRVRRGGRVKNAVDKSRELEQLTQDGAGETRARENCNAGEVGGGGGKGSG